MTVQSVSPASGPAASYTVTVTAGTGEGPLRLDLVDDDSIRDLSGNRLGGSGIGNGAQTGDTVTVHRGPVTPPPTDPPTPPPTDPPTPTNPVTPPVTNPVTPPVTTPVPAAPVPTATAAVRAAKSRSYLFLDVEPNKGSGYWKVQVQRKKSDGSWKSLKSYRTRGAQERRTINLPKGTYPGRRRSQVRIPGQHLSRGDPQEVVPSSDSHSPCCSGQHLGQYSPPGWRSCGRDSPRLGRSSSRPRRRTSWPTVGFRCDP